MYYKGKAFFSLLLLYLGFIFTGITFNLEPRNTLNIVITWITALWFLIELWSIPFLDDFEPYEEDILYKYDIVLIPFAILSFSFLYLGGVLTEGGLACMYIDMFLYLYYRAFVFLTTD